MSEPFAQRFREPFPQPLSEPFALYVRARARLPLPQPHSPFPRPFPIQLNARPPAEALTREPAVDGEPRRPITRPPTGGRAR